MPRKQQATRATQIGESLGVAWANDSNRVAIYGMILHMLLKAIQVQNFRNVIDSDEILVEPDVTCLVGKNESGKTAILQALYRFNPVIDAATFSETRDYPRWRLTKDRRLGSLGDSEPVTCKFELEDSDIAAVEAVVGPGVLTSKDFTRSARYDGGASCDVDLDLEAAKRNIINRSGAADSLAQQLDHVVEPSDLKSAAEALEVPTDGPFSDEDVRLLSQAVVDTLGQATVWDVVVEVLEARMPKFFYFSDYQTLPGRIDIRSLDAEPETPGASGMQAARALLALASTSTGALAEENFDDRKAELEAVSNELTQEVFEYWTQNRELSVEVDLDKVTEVNAAGQHAVARYLEIRVKDLRHGFTNNFDQRSSGFQWFFSFLAAFSQFERYEHGVVVLLDEPALTLHGKAQADFLRFIEERLAPTTPVIYTTHSPFMVDVVHMERVRIVEDRGPDEGAKVTKEVLTVGDDSLFPLQAALGYDIAQSLFVGHDNLLVEGTSDFTYLTVMSDHLKTLGRKHLSDRWRILPAGGATNIPAFVALLGRALEVTVLIDGSLPGVQRLQSFADRGLLTGKRLLLTDHYTAGVTPSDIEDLFAVDDFLKLYNSAFGKSLQASALNGSDRIIARINRIGERFTDHGRPADALLRDRDPLLGQLAEETLARFERLFDDVNKTMTSAKAQRKH